MIVKAYAIKGGDGNHRVYSDTPQKASEPIFGAFIDDQSFQRILLLLSGIAHGHSSYIPKEEVVEILKCLESQK